MDRQAIIQWLRETEPNRLSELWRLADDLRRREVGEQVHLRGLIEFSNYCRRNCGYCGLRIDNREVERYRMCESEILGCAEQARSFGYGTVVLQSGEDCGFAADWLARIIERIKQTTGLAVTLSLGERAEADLRTWKAAGADRYLLRFETANPQLFEHIHPPVGGEKSDRIQLLRTLRELGYEIGSGVMIGIPGQTFEDLAVDLETFRELNLDMIGVGPFIPHQATPLHAEFMAAQDRPEQVPNTEAMTYKAIALARLLCPRANIPSTTALATLNKATGRELGLQRGANVVMPNLTPPEYRAMYEIYPAKACIAETAEQCHGCMKRRILQLGRKLGVGPGHSPNFRAPHLAEQSTASAWPPA